MATITQTQTDKIRALVKAFDFKRLFNELGWDNLSTSLTVEVGGVRYRLQAVAEKRGMVVYVCDQPQGAGFPDHDTRLKIERELVKNVHSHIIVYVDSTQTCQVWQWVRRERGGSTVPREHKFFKGQSGEHLAQRLAHVFIGFDEEESLTGVDVAGRAAQAFDVDRVTKKFYDRFKTEHSVFLQTIAGISDEEARTWYASLMLNRLMFTYFIQKKGFLAGDVSYLPNKLRQVQARYGEGQFHSFYRTFLLKLFHDGLGQPKAARDQATAALIGDIPYLNGGLFELHQIERDYTPITIPDAAFERIFAFFESYEWHLDTEHNDEKHADNEINPDVLGYIFEKYINQKQMGAYYTKEDITEYIGKNTILPFVLEQARINCKVAFERPESEVWRLLSQDPDRYIYEPVRRGVDLDLPPEIAAGVDDVARRGGWNRPAAEGFALPTETWREHVARRTRCLDLRAKLAAGKVTTVNDLITYNLDIRRFTQDVIENCEGPDLLRALWDALSTVTILDPTCGSGAFLFAALTILEPLYTACLERMEAFVTQADATPNTSKALYYDFRATLAKVDQHSNRRYFILKSIIISNLYGVDIMEEATEIAKLRLFLKLVAQVNDVRRLEPLPDIDFNIRAGNTLVGFATLEDARKAVSNHLFWREQMPQIEQDAADIDRLFRHFRQQQMEIGGEVTKEHKRNLLARLETLGATLDQFLAAEYGIDEHNIPNKAAYAARLAEWKRSHRPFHWFIEYYGIVQARGGFDVIIGNPPYVSAAKVRKEYDYKGYKTSSCPDIYAIVLERCSDLVKANGRTGMIVPLSLAFSGDFDNLRQLMYKRYPSSWYSSFARIPSALFSADVRVRNVIHIGARGSDQGMNRTTVLHRWFSEARPHLFSTLDFTAFNPQNYGGLIPRYNTLRIARAFEAMASAGKRVSTLISLKRTRNQVFFKKSAYNWLTFSRQQPPCFDGEGREISQTQFGEFYLSESVQPEVMLSLLNGKLMFSFWSMFGDDFHVASWMFSEFPFDIASLPPAAIDQLTVLGKELESAMRQNVSFKSNAGKRVGTYNLARCRSITDQSDAIIAHYLGLSDVLQDIELLYGQIVKTGFDDEGDAE